MRAEYFRLSDLGFKDADLLSKLKEAYQTMVDRTDPLHRHRGDKVPEKWECPKVEKLERPVRYSLRLKQRKFVEHFPVL